MGERKRGWKRVKFGEVVRLVKETCKDPVAAGISRVIGLEHLEPGDLRVRSWNDIADGTTFTTRVRPGQVLFGKRRAYQRKVAVADFDAICSGDIYVFESANPERLLPGLLPFLCQTDAFFDHAVGTSAGSLSPRTNWTSLAEYEFALPPLEEQTDILRALLATRAHKETAFDLVAASEALARGILDHALRAQTGPFSSMRWRHAIVGDVAMVTKLAGFEYTEHVKYDEQGEIIAIRPMNIKNGRLVLDAVQRISKATSDSLPRSKVRKDDVLFTYIGMYIGEVLHVEDDNRFHLAPNIARISPSPVITGRLLAWLFRSSLVQNQIRSRTTGTYTLSFTMASLRQLKISFPEAIQDQVELADMMDRAWACHLSAEERLAQTCGLSRRLSNWVLSGRGRDALH